jgi:2-oxoisovalerate dehydrogenase E1 component alpha subunit
MCFPTYRMAGWLIARGYPLTDMVNQCSPTPRTRWAAASADPLFGAATTASIPVGQRRPRVRPRGRWAWPSAYQGDSRIAIGYIGEGSTAEGDFHEALTFAAVYRASGDPGRDQQPVGHLQLLRHRRREQTTFAAKGHAYGLPACAWTQRLPGGDGRATAVGARTREPGAHTSSSSSPTGAAGPLHQRRPDPLPPEDEAELALRRSGRRSQHLTAIGEWSPSARPSMHAEAADDGQRAVNEGEAWARSASPSPTCARMFAGRVRRSRLAPIEQRKELGL